ncbi:MAG: hypothetical protein HY319_32580 [Armatimonadetes bacterium]|nr:hypothetical protein [Armatimonadota bacterium]
MLTAAAVVPEARSAAHLTTLTSVLTHRDAGDVEMTSLLPCAGEVVGVAVLLDGVPLEGRIVDRWEARWHYETALSRGVRAVLAERERAHLVGVRACGLSRGVRAELGLELAAGSDQPVRLGDERSFLAVEAELERLPRHRRGTLPFDGCGGMNADGAPRPWPLDPLRGEPLPESVDFEDRCRRMMAGSPVTPESLSGLLRVLDRDTRSARKLVRAAGLLYEGECLLRILCQGHQPAPARLTGWLTRMAGYVQGSRI